MKYDYVITLRRPNYKAVNIISQILVLFYLLAFTRVALETGLPGRSLRHLLIPVSIAVLWIYTAIRSRQKDFVPYYRLQLLMAALGWAMLLWGNYWWLPAVYAIMGFSERFLKFPDEIGFSKEIVVRNTFPKQKFEWVEIENAMLRDNLFTLDLRNNKMIQKELDEPVGKELETEFNAYCKELLHFSLEKKS